MNENICVRQAENVDMEGPCQKIRSILGTVIVQSRTTLRASMARKRYMGSWRLRSQITITITRPLSVTAKKYMKLKGMEIQIWKSSNPGTPVSKKAMKGVDV